MLARRSLKALAAAAAALTVAAGCGSSGSGGGGTGNGSGSDGGGGGGQGALKIGYILPQTGDLAKEGLGKPQIAAVRYAVKVINEAGGVNGKKLPTPPGADETSDASKATVNVGNLLNNNVDAIIGAAASSMTLAIIDKVVQSQVLECSGSNTTPTLTDYKDDGFYFRTAPSDALQGPVLGNLVVKTGHKKIVVAARADDYGRGLQKATVSAIKAAGGDVLATPTYDTQATNYDALVSKIRNAQPDAVVLISFGEAAQILKGLIEAGMGPNKIGIFGADGERSEELPKQVSPGKPDVLDGMMGTAPASAANQKFLQDLKAFDTSLTTEQYAPQVFDCTVTVALAAEEAKSSDPTKIKEHMIDVTKGGTTCASFAECKKMLDQGTDINYDGVSGPLDFDEHGEPASASIEVWQFKNGELSTVRTVTSKK
jgi:branched-chain amino acid transport system substrate-binding protein